MISGFANIQQVKCKDLKNQVAYTPNSAYNVSLSFDRRRIELDLNTNFEATQMSFLRTMAGILVIFAIYFF